MQVIYLYRSNRSDLPVVAQNHGVPGYSWFRVPGYSVVQDQGLRVLCLVSGVHNQVRLWVLLGLAVDLDQGLNVLRGLPVVHDHGFWVLLAPPVVQDHGLLVLRGTSVVHVRGLCVFLELSVVRDLSDVVGTSVVLSVVSGVGSWIKRRMLNAMYCLEATKNNLTMYFSTNYALCINCFG